MGLVSRIGQTFSAVVKAAEGAWRPGPYYLPVTHGFLPDGAAVNWWQCGETPYLAGTRLAIIEACIGAYSQTMAMCPGSHWRANGKGGRDRVTNSALCRILRYPNDYQSISDLILNTVRQLYLEGNAYLLCMRNARYEIEELHLMDNRYSRAMIDGEGEVHYVVGGNWIVQNRYGPLTTVPARDVLHIKLHVDQLRNPLRGESPLVSAYLDALTGQSIRAQQYVFYQNQAKPGFVLSTDLVLDKDQVSALRDRWSEQSTGANAGGTPILTNGLKPLQIPVTNFRDAQLAEVLRLTDQDIAMAFRVPAQLVGLQAAHTTPHSSTEALMQSWVASGLGFCLNHIEEAIGQTFELDGQPDEYVEFDTGALLRSDFKDRIDSLARAVQGGIMSPNEARNSEDLDSVPFGDEPRVQQQVVPLSQVGKIPPAPAAPSQPSAPPSDKKPTQQPPGSSQKADANVAANGIARVMFTRAKRIQRQQQREQQRLLSS
ncbi:MAG TPA: phage portal protein [Xanthobacteraceae bacterium]|jgi:HK97 family phage portal protein